jgi:hypothetical protein
MVDNSVRVYAAAKLLESLSKNSSLLFHIMNSRKALTPPYLQAVHRSVPGKRSLKNKLEQKSVKSRWEKSDQLLLSLIQLWADTFMMQEDKFPGYMVVFRQLSKDGVKFPARDPNMRMFMEQFVKDSPMYDYVEQIAGRSHKPAVEQVDQEEAKAPPRQKQLPVPQSLSFDFELNPPDTSFG